ncbi:MAG: GNAT family N-acetyltransferase [Chloroflexi bacterium]|nr:GNAT family N-acetyltransferase [Chloroflexota bacterium]
MNPDDKPPLCKSPSVSIREMEIDDIAQVFHLGERLYTSSFSRVLYRTWDPFEVTYYFNGDPEYCLVAEDKDGEVVGFALGTTIEKDHSAWKYGYLAWLGVSPECQGHKVGHRLTTDFEKRMRAKGVRILLVDTEATNAKAIRFFQRNGFSDARNHVWMSKTLDKNTHGDAKPIKPITRAKKQVGASRPRKGRPSPTVPAFAAPAPD